MLALVLCCSAISISTVIVMWFCTNSFPRPPQSPESPPAPPSPMNISLPNEALLHQHLSKPIIICLASPM
ncbi:hypothetical protein ES288_D11G215400v1 [Gossypium darwinii]|nr:hypothetical protein ES288_D11G215400v1 [Gossypium darwinii]